MGGKSIPFWLLRLRAKKSCGLMELVQSPLEKVSPSFLISSPITFCWKSPLSSSACSSRSGACSCWQVCLTSLLGSCGETNSYLGDDDGKKFVGLLSSNPPSGKNYEDFSIKKHYRSTSPSTLLGKILRIF